jgi:hypothetical protein
MRGVYEYIYVYVFEVNYIHKHVYQNIILL